MYTFSGFRDGHCHPLFAAREGNGPDVTGLASVQEIVAALRAYLAENPDCIWVDCGSFAPSLEADSTLTKGLLDQVSTAVPIVVHAEDHHSIWVNSAALAVANCLAEAPKFDHAYFELDTDGLPTGRVFEWDAMSVIYAHQPAPSLESDLLAIERFQNRLLAAGVVAVQDAWIDPGMPEPYLEAARSGLLKIRVNLAVRVAPDQWREQMQFAKTTRSAVRAVENQLLTCNTVKIFVDGVFDSQTALLAEPYGSGGYGSQLWDAQELAEMALAADSAGFQLHFHAIGDAAVDAALDAIEHVDLVNGFVDRRPVIAHADLLADSSLPRLRQLGVILCQQPTWAIDGPSFSATKTLVGEARESRLFRFSDILEARVPLAFGSDWPVSAPEALPGIVAACSPANAQQALTRGQAIRAYSTTVAYQMGTESMMKWDSVTFDIDLESATDAELLTATVLSVTVAGNKVWPN